MDVISLNHVYLYTDGGCRGNQSENNIGSYAYVLLFNEHIAEGGFPAHNTTNNRMELKAVIAGLEQLNQFNIPITVRSDSAYVVNCMQQKWYNGWINRNWRTANNKPVGNKELWLELIKLVNKFEKIEFEKVKGHSDNKYNNRCDELVNTIMDNIEKGENKK